MHVATADPDALDFHEDFVRRGLGDGSRLQSDIADAVQYGCLQHHEVYPPSTTTLLPVMKLEAALARKTATLAI